MSSILEKWLQNSIGRSISVNPATLGDDCFDGRLYAKILSTYGICDQHYVKNIVKTDKYCSVYNNLRKLCVWFKLLEIPYTENLLKDIANKNGDSALKLLYQLFLRLEGRDNIKLYVEEKFKKPLKISEQDDINETNIENNRKEDVKKAPEKKKFGTIKFSLQNSIRELERRRLMADMMIWKKNVPILKNILEDPISKAPDVFKDISDFEKEMERPEKQVVLGIEKWRPNTFISFTKIKQRLREDENYLRYISNKKLLEEAWRNALKNNEEINGEQLANKLYHLSEKEKEIAFVLGQLRNYQENERVETSNILKGPCPKEEPRKEIDIDHKKVLHNRLFRIKMNTKRKLLPLACEKIAHDLADLSFLQGEFKITTLMDKLLKYMFRKGVTVIQKPEPHEPSSGKDPDAIEKELISEFHDYIFLTGVWDPQKVLGIGKYLGSLNVVGHIVHRILRNEIKTETPEDHLVRFPSFEMRILLRPRLCPELSRQLTSKLQPNIIVLNMDVAVEYALSAYRLFYFEQDESDDHDSQKESRFSEITQRDGKPGHQEPKTSVRTSKKISVPRFRDKGVQVPSDIALDSHEQRLTPPRIILLAELVFHFLKTKKEIPYILKCFIIIDIIKNLDGFSGWMVINFVPSPIGIALLEYVYSGSEPSFLKKKMKLEAEWNKLKKQLTPIKETLCAFESCYLKTTNEKIVDNEQDQANSPNNFNNDDMNGTKKGLSNIEKALEAIRKLCELMVFSFDEELAEINSRNNDPIEMSTSNILPKPYPDASIKPFQSIFTHVIRVSDRFSQMRQRRKTNEEATDEEELEEELTETKEEQNGTNISELNISVESVVTDNIDDFYEEKGLFLKFPFSKYSENRLKFLILAISQSKYLKKSVYFPHFVTLLAEKYFENRSEGQINLVNGTPSVGSSGEKEKHIDLLREFSEENCEEENFVDSVEEECVIVHPGHAFWSYTTPFISLEYSKPLKTIWERVEADYLYNLREIFLFLKHVDSRFIFCSNYISSKCDECLAITDNRENIALCFLNTMNNGLETKSPSTKPTRDDLHCSIFKLQRILWQLADAKKQYSQGVVDGIKTEPVKILCKYANSFNLLHQTEVDRFIYTMQLIMDYHCMILMDAPSKERLHMISLPEFKHEFDMEEPGRALKISASANRLKSQQTFLTRNVKFDTKIELHIEGGSDLPRLLIRIEEILKHKIKCVGTLCKKIHKYVWPIVLFKQDQSRYEEVSRLMREWSAALKEETRRAKFMIGLIHARAMKVVEGRTSTMEDRLVHFGKDVSRQYRIEIYSIDKFCDSLKAAIKAQVKLEARNYQFYGNPYIKYDCPTRPTTRAKFPTTGCKFTFKHLTNLFKKFSEIAPTGVIKQSLIYILQDMAMTGHELRHPYIPFVWSYLTPENIAYVVNQCFGEKPVVSWKEFLLFALDVRYPTLREIWHLKKEYKKYDRTGLELINYKKFKQTSLWFQKGEDLNSEMRLCNCKLKDLLFDLFETEGHLNYNCFLLTFCKDTNQNVAFLKALTVIDNRIFKLLANKSVYTDTFREFEKLADVMELWNKACEISDLEDEEFEDSFPEEESEPPYLEPLSAESFSHESLIHESASHESFSDDIFRLDSDLLIRIEESVPRKVAPFEESFLQRSARKKSILKKLDIKKSARKKSLTLKKLELKFFGFLSNARKRQKKLSHDNKDIECEYEEYFEPDLSGFESRKKKRISKRDRLHLKKMRWPRESRLLKIAKAYALYSIRQGIRNHKLHKDRLIALFMFEINYFAFHPKFSSKVKCLAEKMKNIFENGKGFTVCVREILDNCYVKKLMSSHAFFRPISLRKYACLLREARKKNA